MLSHSKCRVSQRVFLRKARLLQMPFVVHPSPACCNLGRLACKEVDCSVCAEQSSRWLCYLICICLHKNRETQSSTALQWRWIVGHQSKDRLPDLLTCWHRRWKHWFLMATIFLWRPKGCFIKYNRRYQWLLQAGFVKVSILVSFKVL